MAALAHLSWPACAVASFERCYELRPGHTRPMNSESFVSPSPSDQVEDPLHCGA